MLYNVKEYHRPVDIQDALRLLRREEVHTAVLGGGASLLGSLNGEIEALVDLQALDLDQVERAGTTVSIGAMVRLQNLIDEHRNLADGLLARTARQAAGWNLRNQMTAGGMLAGEDVHNPVSVAAAALSVRVKLAGEEGEAPVWAALSSTAHRGALRRHIITHLIYEDTQPLGTAYHQIGRTPADLPIVCAAAAVRADANSGLNCVLVVGGFTHNLLVLSDTITTHDPASTFNDLVDRVRRAGASDTEVRSDFLGQPDYRRMVAPVLAHRALVEAFDRVGKA